MDDFPRFLAPNSVHGPDIDARNRPGTPYWRKGTGIPCRYLVRGRIQLVPGRRGELAALHLVAMATALPFVWLPPEFTASHLGSARPANRIVQGCFGASGSSSPALLHATLQK